MAENLNFDRLVHLDLKGAPPKLSYLRKLLPVFKRWGATGLLIEYEDTFCYTGSLSILAAPHSYTYTELKEFLKLCAQYRLDVIPLVQTFGHMEFVLKHDAFTHLREHEWYPNSICPSTEQSFQILTSMLDQIIDFHSFSNTFHIGCDEVHQLGVCAACRLAIASRGWTRDRLFCEHVTRLANQCRVKRGQECKILIWDDMLRSMDISDMKVAELTKTVQPVVWYYGSDAIPDVWRLYEQFPAVWAATAFKGASGPVETTPDTALHVANHKLWCAVIEDKRNLTKWAGVIVTGWSRYDHFGVLCELLPAALPSLALCLHILNEGSFCEFSHSRASESVGFQGNDLLPIIQRPRPQPVHENWNFVGREIYIASHRQANLKVHFKEYLYDSDCYMSVFSFVHWLAVLVADWLMPGVELLFRGWFHSYNVKRRFLNHGIVRQLLARAEELLQEFERLRQYIAFPLSECYPPIVCEEWTETHLNVFIRKLRKTSEKMQTVLSESSDP